MASYDDTATVSGSVVGFSNGADSVPLKNWLVTLPASLDGYTEVNGKKSGKNILPNTAQTATENNVTYKVNSDGTVSLSGTCNADTNFYIYSGFTFPKLGRYFFSGCPSGGSTSTYRVFLTNFGADTGSGYALNVTNLSTTTSIRINIKSGVVTDGLVFKPQLEVGSTATAYEAYEAPTTYTASIGRTVYGGTADIVTGEGEAQYDITALDDKLYNYISGITRFNVAISGIDASGYKDNIVIPTGYTISHQLITNASGAPDMTMCVYNGSLYVKNLSCSSRADLQSALSGESLVFPLATPTAFTFTPITPTPETAKGSNTFWSDQGNTELTYYKDGYGFTSVTIHKETTEGEPVEETRKLHRIIYEGQVDVINGTGLIYRGESGTQYDPPEQISFTPIEIATDEGENTLYADQGDSAITYRKAVD